MLFLDLKYRKIKLKNGFLMNLNYKVKNKIFPQNGFFYFKKFIFIHTFE